jgi:hypothetical protein
MVGAFTLRTLKGQILKNVMLKGVKEGIVFAGV